MIFAKIDFINLLPFHIHMKKKASTQLKQIVENNKSYPAYINKRYKKRVVHSAFISSVKSKREKSLDLGIVARDEVLSVLALKSENYKKDFQSDTSNALAQILNIKGEVLIGDKALKYYHETKNKDFIDLAKAWQDKYNLPFVFARLCFNKHKKQLENLTKNFDKRKIKIPQYILKQYSKRSGVSQSQILHYLTKIDYEIGYKEKRALKLFFKLAKQKGII